ncbi:MAG: SUF system NifU family Fe-S cluster assembly protein [Puniceicoccaceae bacterium]|nr:MAG: SUF system NifU family Fe-S cluster assembly protein [Puniceicoccaceae bacterium]
MSDLEDLYQEIILDHNRRPRNFGPLPEATHHAEGHNPLCGDHIKVLLRLEDDVVREVKFEGEGCAISKASASLMTTHLKGKKLGAVREAFRAINHLLTSQEDEIPELETLGDVAALQGVRRYPVRVKCASLAWHAADAALDGVVETTTE